MVVDTAYSFFGFDPIDKQYKAVSMKYPFGPGRHKVLTFGDGDMTWKGIKCSLQHEVGNDGVCINGVLYYLGDTSRGDSSNDDHYVIVCFDLRSEKFTFIGVKMFCHLINYNGKLALFFWEDEAISGLNLWVLEDVEKQEWSKYAYTWTDDKFLYRDVSIIGGEIVFSMDTYTPKEPFYVVYFNPGRNTLQCVEIQGFGEAFEEPCRVFTFVNHVEDLNVNDLKMLKSLHAPFEKLPEYAEYSDPESD